RIGLPRRMVAILEGESLINDATALVLFRVASAALVGEAMSGWHIAEAIGVVGGLVIAWVHRRIKDPLLDNAVSLITPFAVYIPAEQLEASGVVAVVIAGLYLGHRFPGVIRARS